MMTPHLRECITDALLEVQHAQTRLACIGHLEGVHLDALAEHLSLAEVHLRSLARAARDELRAAETESPRAEDGR